MASPGEEFTLETVRDFMIHRGGRVTNHELVQHFKAFLTHTDNKELARNQFKQYVNALSHVVKEDENKYLVLKKKYRVGTPLAEPSYGNHTGDPRQPPVPCSPEANYNDGPDYPRAGYSPNVSAGGYNNSPAPGGGQPYSNNHVNAQYGGGSPQQVGGYPPSHMSNSHQQGYNSPQQSMSHQYHQTPPTASHHASRHIGGHPQAAMNVQDSQNHSYSGLPQQANSEGYLSSELPAPPLPPRSQQQQQQQSSSYNSNQQQYTPPKYRAPPPYRPPPGPMRTPPDPNAFTGSQGPTFPSPQHNNNHQSPQAPAVPPELSMAQSSRYNNPKASRSHDYQPKYPDQYPPTEELSYPNENYRNNNQGMSTYSEPSDLGIPPAPVQSVRSNNRPNSGSTSPMNVVSSSNLPQSSRPNKLPVQPQPSLANVPTPVDELQQLRPTKSKSKSKTPPFVQAGTNSAPATSSPAGDSSTSGSPVAPHIKLRDNKENRKPSLTNSESSNSRQESPSSAGDESDSRAGATLKGENEKKISVKEKTQIFNKMASETNLERINKSGSKSNRSSRAEKDYDDSVSILKYGQDGQDWLVASASSDFNEILRLLKIHPELVRRKDRNNGYTALHWAAKHGRVEVVKLLAGTHQAHPNVKTNGGYTPLHLAAMYNRQDVFDLLVHYGSDLNMRDYSGKKPRQYSTITSCNISPEHHKRKYLQEIPDDVEQINSDTDSSPEPETKEDKPRQQSRSGSAPKLHITVTTSPSRRSSANDDGPEHFARAKKNRTSFFSRASIFSSKRKNKARREVSGSIGSRDMSPGRRSEPIVISGPMTSRLLPGNNFPPPEQQFYPRRSRGRSGRRPRYRQPPMNRRPNSFSEIQHPMPYAADDLEQRSRSSTVQEEQLSYGKKYNVSKPKRSPSSLSIASLFGKRKASRIKSTSQPNLCPTDHNYNEQFDSNGALVTESKEKPVKSSEQLSDNAVENRPDSSHANAACSAAPVQVFKSSNAPSGSKYISSPAPWPMADAKPLRKQMIAKEYGSASRLDSMKSNDDSFLTSRKNTSAVSKHNQKNIGSTSAKAKKQVTERYSSAGDVGSDSDSKSKSDNSDASKTDSESSDDDSSDSSTYTSKKLSALTIKAKLEKKREEKRKMQATIANKETEL